MEEEKHYLLDRDSTETQRYSFLLVINLSFISLLTRRDRLNRQHGYLQEILGFYIHPSIPLDQNDANIWIADIAAGTGIWLYEAAQNLPKAWQFNGFDISAAQFPPLETWPENVGFYQHNALKPFPERCRGYFDIIAIRALQVAMGNEDWAAVCKNVKQCLSTSFRQLCKYLLIMHTEPGGHIQWIEPDLSPTGWKTISVVPGCEKSALEEVISTLHKIGKLTGKDYAYAHKLPALLESHGFEDVRSEIMAVDKEGVRTAHTGDLAKAFVPWYKQYAQELGMTVEQAVKIGEDGREQALKGDAYNRMDFHVVVGRKAG